MKREFNSKELSLEASKRIVPEPSGWQCELFGAHSNIVWTPVKGDVPNFFWRWMQYLCFGNKWKKIRKAKA
jgi:hypothetical protein